MQFGSMLVYCTVYDMYVCGGAGAGGTSIFFQGAPNPLATALVSRYASSQQRENVKSPLCWTNIGDVFRYSYRFCLHF